MTSNVKPESQGTMDGLCGMYAIVNALCTTSPSLSKDQVFQATCSGLANSRWPKVLWDWTTFGDMQRMIKNCMKELEVDHAQVRYPFVKNTPTTNAEYWDRFDELFEADDVVCAIMGMTWPSMHWIVAGHDGGHIQFLDSTIDKGFQRKRRSNLFAGERRQTPSQWLLDRQELIVFSRV